LGSRDRNRCATCSEQSGDGFLGKPESAFTNTFLHDQKPSAESLHEGMSVIANSEVGNLDQQVVVIPEEHVTQSIAILEEIAKN